ncbi:MAG: hypothetical protein P4L59_18315 [Desulfosporosinus sp.]|nr:hypothetical protein [Desulfosporosinus sp.]
MFVLIIIALAGLSLYFLLKPPTDFKNEPKSRRESLSEPELAVTKKDSRPTTKGFRKVL